MNVILTRIVACVLAAITFCAAGLMLGGLNGWSGWGPLTPPRVAADFDRRAERALSEHPTRPRLDEARRLSKAAIDRAPYDTGAMLRLAYIDRLSHGRLTAEGIAALELSYDRVPVDPAVALWRIEFALSNWTEIRPALRRKVQREVEAVMTEPGHRWPLRQRLRRIREPNGVVVARLWDVRIDQLQTEVRRRTMGGAPEAATRQ